jgi:hypothetical protein
MCRHTKWTRPSKFPEWSSHKFHNGALFAVPFPPFLPPTHSELPSSISRMTTDAIVNTGPKQVRSGTRRKVLRIDRKKTTRFSYSTNRKQTKSLASDGGRRTDPSSPPDAVIGLGRGALISAMFGAGWLGWGLGNAKAFNGFVAPTFGFTALFLFACSIYFIRKVRLLRKQCPAAGASTRNSTLKWFLFVALIEVLAIALVAILADRLHRTELATDWCAMIVGLHFLPLAKIFRAPQLGVLGVLMILWCVLSWALFQSSAIAISASLGTGILLWGSCAISLLRARRIAQSTST